MVPIIQFWIILQQMYKMSQNLQKLAFFNEHVQIFDGNILWYIRPRFFKNAAKQCLLFYQITNHRKLKSKRVQFLK